MNMTEEERLCIELMEAVKETMIAYGRQAMASGTPQKAVNMAKLQAAAMTHAIIVTCALDIAPSRDNAGRLEEAAKEGTRAIAKRFGRDLVAMN